MNLKPPRWCAHSLERCCRPSSTTEFHPILSSIPSLLCPPPVHSPPTCNTLHIISNSTVTPRCSRFPRLALTLPPTAVSKVELKPSPSFAALIAPHHPRLPFTQMWAYVASFNVSPKYEIYFHVFFVPFLCVLGKQLELMIKVGAFIHWNRRCLKFNQERFGWKRWWKLACFKHHQFQWNYIKKIGSYARNMSSFITVLSSNAIYLWAPLKAAPISSRPLTQLTSLFRPPAQPFRNMKETRKLKDK